MIRNLTLSNGLVDIKVCAIDEIWSGLKLVNLTLKVKRSGMVAKGDAVVGSEAEDVVFLIY